MTHAFHTLQLSILPVLELTDVTYILTALAKLALSKRDSNMRVSLTLVSMSTGTTRVEHERLPPVRALENWAERHIYSSLGHLVLINRYMTSPLKNFTLQFFLAIFFWLCCQDFSEISST